MNAATHREFKDRLFEQFARVGKALASPKRLEIVDLLAQGERTVEEIARETAMSVASASQHLQALKTARMVEVRREGLYMHYRLADEDVFRIWQAVRAFAESRLSEVDRVVETYLVDRDALEAVDATELMERLTTGSVVVLDVRPEEEYRAGHILGGLSVPVDTLEAALRPSRETGRSSPTAGGPTACSPMRRSRSSGRCGYRARRPGKGCPTGGRPGCPWRARTGVERDGRQHRRDDLEGHAGARRAGHGRGRSQGGGPRRVVYPAACTSTPTMP